MISNRSVEIGVSGFLMLFGAYIAWGSIGYGYLDGSTPGPGFFPLWLGLGLVGFSAINLVKVLRHTALATGIEKAEIGRVALCTLALAAFAWAGGLIGMLPAAFLLMVAIGAVFGPVSARFYAVLAVVSAGVTGVLYAIFAVALAVPLL